MFLHKKIKALKTKIGKNVKKLPLDYTASSESFSIFDRQSLLLKSPRTSKWHRLTREAILFYMKLSGMPAQLFNSVQFPLNFSRNIFQIIRNHS